MEGLGDLDAILTLRFNKGRWEESNKVNNSTVERLRVRVLGGWKLTRARLVGHDERPSVPISEPHRNRHDCMRLLWTGCANCGTIALDDVTTEVQAVDMFSDHTMIAAPAPSSA